MGAVGLWAPWVFVPIWATGFVSARLAMPHAPPLSFLAWRFALSGIGFLVWLLLARAPWPKRDGRPDWRTLGHVSVAGLLMQVGYLGGVWAAVRLGMGAGLIALIVGLQPVITAAWVRVKGHESVGPAQWIGLVLGLSGVLVAVSHKLGQGEVTAANAALALTALAAITIGTLYQKAYVPPMDTRVAQSVQMIASFAVMTPLSWLEPGGMGSPLAWPTPLTIALVWSVLGLTLGGSSLLFWLIARGAATRVTSLLYLVPPMTAVMAWLLFDEPLGGRIAVALGLTAVGVWLVNRPTPRTR